MSVPQSAQSAKLVVSVFMQDRALFERVAAELCACFGAMEMLSPWYDFDFTTYYDIEMGTPLYRRVIVHKELVRQDALAAVKLRTNNIENRFQKDGKRRVNLDPGYLLLERFVLATGKNFTHRIYLGQGIYADLTLIFQKGRYQPLPWTYPDYQAPGLLDFLHKVRSKYALDIV